MKRQSVITTNTTIMTLLSTTRYYYYCTQQASCPVAGRNPEQVEYDSNTRFTTLVNKQITQARVVCMLLIMKILCQTRWDGGLQFFFVLLAFNAILQLLNKRIQVQTKLNTHTHTHTHSHTHLLHHPSSFVSEQHNVRPHEEKVARQSSLREAAPLCGGKGGNGETM